MLIDAGQALGPYFNACGSRAAERRLRWATTDDGEGSCTGGDPQRTLAHPVRLFGRPVRVT